MDYEELGKEREKIKSGSCYRNSRHDAEEASEVATLHPLDLENAPNEMRIEILFLAIGREVCSDSYMLKEA